MPRDARELVALLDLETIDDNLFRGAVQESRLPRVFGGQVAAQALVAAQRTVDPAYAVHSLHSYFLQPGDTTTPIIYDAEPLRDGRSFATRRVLARQHGRPIFAPPTSTAPSPAASTSRGCPTRRRRRSASTPPRCCARATAPGRSSRWPTCATSAAPTT
ncbi:MAG: thioesterase family protein, partial [Nocardioides sp.]|nr:thioesterase family protein [Nocardioides sp.]